MTTLDPGASVVFTQGFVDSPRSTALRASRAAPIITCGLDVLVHEVMDAMTTAPWSSSNETPSALVAGVGLCARPPAVEPLEAGASGAGKLNSDSMSTLSSET